MHVFVTCVLVLLFVALICEALRRRNHSSEPFATDASSCTDCNVGGLVGTYVADAIQNNNTDTTNTDTKCDSVTNLLDNSSNSSTSSTNSQISPQSQYTSDHYANLAFAQPCYDNGDNAPNNRTLTMPIQVGDQVQVDISAVQPFMKQKQLPSKPIRARIMQIFEPNIDITFNNNTDKLKQITYWNENSNFDTLSLTNYANGLTDLNTNINKQFNDGYQKNSTGNLNNVFNNGLTVYPNQNSTVQSLIFTSLKSPNEISAVVSFEKASIQAAYMAQTNPTLLLLPMRYLTLVPTLNGVDTCAQFCLNENPLARSFTIGCEAAIPNTASETGASSGCTCVCMPPVPMDGDMHSDCVKPGVPAPNNYTYVIDENAAQQYEMSERISCSINRGATNANYNEVESVCYADEDAASSAMSSRCQCQTVCEKMNADDTGAIKMCENPNALKAMLSKLPTKFVTGAALTTCPTSGKTTNRRCPDTTTKTTPEPSTCKEKDKTLNVRRHIRKQTRLPSCLH